MNFLRSNQVLTLSVLDGYSQEICDFIAKCLHKNPKERPTVLDLLKHSFITKYCTEDEPFCHDYQVWVQEVIQRRQHQLYQQKESDEQEKMQLLQSLRL